MKALNENFLNEYAICPLRTFGDSRTEFGPAFETKRHLAGAGLAALNWYLLRLFIGENPTIHEIHVVLEGVLRNDYGWSIRKLRNKGIHACRSMAKTLDTIFLNYKVLQPITPYHLMIEGDTITGSYAVLESLHPRGRRSILRILDGPCDQRMPDIISMARWLHYTSQTEEIAGLYNISLDGKYPPVLHQGMNESVVRTYLSGILKSVRNGCYFPSPGNHCSICLTTACMEAVNHGK